MTTWLTYLCLKLNLQEFIEHCCTSKHYFFSIKKCGESACTIYRPSRCLLKDFEQLYHLPDPVPGEDLHYKSFEELYSKQTTEDHRPLLKNAKIKTKGKMKTTKVKHTMPFCPSVAHAKNVGVTIDCIEYEKLRLLFSVKKLLKRTKQCYENSLIQSFTPVVCLFITLVILQWLYRKNNQTYKMIRRMKRMMKMNMNMKI